MSVCKECLRQLRWTRFPSAPIPSRRQQPQCAFSTFTITAAPPTNPFPARRPERRTTQHRERFRRVATYSSSPALSPNTPPDLNAIHTRVKELSQSVLSPEDGPLPPEQRILYVFEQLESLARVVLDERAPSPSGSNRQHGTATSALLGSVNARQHFAVVSRSSLLNIIGERAEEIVRHPNVFITAAGLKAYVELQTLLRTPSSFPDVFDLYATKPVPQRKVGRQVEYIAASPNKISAAIDRKTADTALTAAIQTHDLTLAIDVITTSFSTLAFKNAKLLRQGAVPLSGVAIAPVAAYTLSTYFSSMQQAMDPSTATGIAFAGIMTYVGAVVSMGYITITTANDQMDRITWATGVPLWERWIREEERAAIDRVAGAWGFSDKEKKGEEEGEDWETLREWAGRRGMVLDRANLMEGME